VTVIEGIVHILEFVNLFFAGLLAGAEFVVRFGVRAAIGALDPQPSIRLRQALIRTLRALVPGLYLPTLLTGIAVTIWNGGGFALRCAAMLALLGWTLVTFTGTVPINAAILDEWQAETPPADWKATIHRWERLDTARTLAALATFALFLAAAAVRRS
jgi:uncharacterized membrane protein